MYHGHFLKSSVFFNSDFAAFPAVLLMDFSMFLEYTFCGDDIMSILYLYITVFTIYYIILAATSIKPQKKVRDKYTSKDSNICVAVYATGEVKTLVNLVNQLKNQTYPKHRYTIYTILDKCENIPEVMLQSDLDVNVININNLEPIGKSQAYSILAEKLSEAHNLDAYVFLDAKNYVDSDFLANVNYYLTKYRVFMPMVNYIGEYKELKFWECVKATYSRYCSKFLFATRTRLGLTNLINTDAFVIRKEILSKIASFDFQDKTAEVKYTVKLAREKVYTAFVDELKVYTDISNYDSRIPSLSKRLDVFRENFVHPGNFINQEYVYSLIAPNWLVCILCYGLLLSHAYVFPFWVGYATILISFIVLALAFCVSLFNAKIYAKEYFYLFAYPVYSVAHIIKNFPPIRFVVNFLFNRKRRHNIEKMLTNVIVTDGKKDFQCQLELISDDGLARVKFINKGKTYTTKNNHLRMVDAIKELSGKLNDYGLSLKVCQCCKYFQPVVDGSTNMIKGCCNCKFQGRVEGDIIPTLVWNTCPRFEEQNVVNLF